MNTDLDLCVAYLDDALAAAELESFEERLLDDAELAELLYEVARDDVIVRDWAASMTTVTTVGGRLRAWLGRRWVIAAFSAAALVVVAVMTWPAGDGVDVRVTKLAGPVWADGHDRAIGARLSAGERLSLAAGAVEVVYGNGTEVRLEGPGTYIVSPLAEGDDPDPLPVHGELPRGTITVHCPPGAEGFTVDGPGVRVRDLGTRFTLSIDERGTAEATVHEGNVELSRLDGDGAVRARRTLFASEHGTFEANRIVVTHREDAAAPRRGSLHVRVRETIERSRRDYQLDDYAYGPRQEHDEATGETRISLPYGNRPALFGEVRGVLVDPTVSSADFHSTDRTTDAVVEYHLKFDEPIAAFRLTDARSEWELGANTVGGVEYSVDGRTWRTLREIAGPRVEAFDSFVDGQRVAGLETRELRLRYYTRPAGDTPGPPGERWLKLHLTGGPLYGDETTPFFDHHLELTVTPNRPRP